jgi:hypothetical protein
MTTKRGRLIIAGASVALLFLPLALTAAVDVERAEAIAAGVVERYASFDAFEMSFEQTSYWALADSALTTSGTLFVDRPDLVAVAYEGGGRIVVRGDSLRAFAPESNQFFVAGVDTSSAGIDPAGLLRSYRPDPVAPIRSTRDDPRFVGEPPVGAIGLALLPRNALTEPALLIVRVATEADRVLSILAVASTGDWTRYDII